MRGSDLTPAFWPIVVYLISGTVLTVYNKWLLTPVDPEHPSRYYGFPYPVTLILIHMITTSCFALLLCLVVPSLREELRRVRASTSRRAFFKKYVPIGVLTGFDILLTNVGFKISSVALVELVKSGNIIVVLVVSILRGKERGSLGKVLAVLTLAMGIALAKKGEVDSNSAGFLAALGALAAASIRILAMEYLLHQGTPAEAPAAGSGGHNYTQVRTIGGSAAGEESDADDRLLLLEEDLRSEGAESMLADGSRFGSSTGFRSPHRPGFGRAGATGGAGVASAEGGATVWRSERHGGMHPTVFLLHWAPVAAVALVPSWFQFERERLLEDDRHPPQEVAWVLLLGALLALALNISELQLLQRTNAVSMGVISVVKLVVVIFTTIWLFQGNLGLVNMIGTVVSLGGVIGYQAVKCAERGEPLHQPLPQASPPKAGGSHRLDDFDLDDLDDLDDLEFGIEAADGGPGGESEMVLLSDRLQRSFAAKFGGDGSGDLLLNGLRAEDSWLDVDPAPK